MSKTRRRLAEAILKNGGYRDREGNWALSWNVALDGIPSRKEIYACLVKHFYQHEFDLNIQYPSVVDLIDAQIEQWAGETGEATTWHRVQESMWDSVSGGDWAMMWGVDTARKHRFAYKGKGAEKPFDVKFALHGRSGKHLVVEEFEGIELKDSYHRSLATAIEENVDYCPSLLWCRQLLAMIEEWDKIFSRENVLAEEIYQYAWIFNTEVLEAGSGMESATNLRAA